MCSPKNKDTRHNNALNTELWTKLQRRTTKFGKKKKKNSNSIVTSLPPISKQLQLTLEEDTSNRQLNGATLSIVHAPPTASMAQLTIHCIKYIKYEIKTLRCRLFLSDMKKKRQILYLLNFRQASIWLLFVCALLHGSLR